MEGVSDIKLIRTDTTLDLSQKAEKVCLPWFFEIPYRALLINRLMGLFILKNPSQIDYFRFATGNFKNFKNRV